MKMEVHKSSGIREFMKSLHSTFGCRVPACRPAFSRHSSRAMLAAGDHSSHIPPSCGKQRSKAQAASGATRAPSAAFFHLTTAAFTGISSVQGPRHVPSSWLLQAQPLPARQGSAHGMQTAQGSLSAPGLFLVAEIRWQHKGCIPQVSDVG